MLVSVWFWCVACVVLCCVVLRCVPSHEGAGSEVFLVLRYGVLLFIYLLLLFIFHLFIYLFIYFFAMSRELEGLS